MSDFLSLAYPWIKAFHVMAVLSWMAGLFYLPRLFVHHAERGGAEDEPAATLAMMEEKLLRLIMNPAMIATWIFGLLLTWQGGWWHSGWWHAKFTLICVLTVVHHLYGRWRKDFAADRNIRPANYYRWWNEVPTLLMIAIVFLVVLKPF